MLVRPRIRRRATKRRVHRSKLVCFLLIVLMFCGCSDNWFRLKPKKGRPHPHLPKEESFNRTWLYQHTIEPVNMFSEEERKYRAERARQLALQKEFYAASINQFDRSLRKIAQLNFQLADTIFANLLISWFHRALDLKGYSISPSKSFDLAASESEDDNFLTGCSSNQQPGVKILSHLQYGNDPNDTDTYYEVHNGFFTISQDDRFCRVFRLDIVRFGRKGNGDAADTDKVLSLFSSEDIWAEQVWSGDKDYPDDISVMHPDTSELEDADINYPDELKALFNFMQMKIHNPLAVRFQEILVNKDPTNSGVKRSPTHIIRLVKNEVIEVHDVDVHRSSDEH